MSIPFAAFVSTESEIACNPVTSFHILRAAEPTTEKINLKETKGNRVRAFTNLSNTESKSDQICEQNAVCASSGR